MSISVPLCIIAYIDDDDPDEQTDPSKKTDLYSIQ